MPRPKTSEKTFSFRSWDEVMSDVDASADRLQISRSKWINNAIFMALKLPWVIQADWFRLRELDPVSLRLHCATMSDGKELPRA